LFALAPLAHGQSAGTHTRKRAHKPATNGQGTSQAASTHEADALEKQLARLSRALHDHPNPTTYAALSAFSTPERRWRSATTI
jgi:hypothetical protein